MPWYFILYIILVVMLTAGLCFDMIFSLYELCKFCSKRESARDIEEAQDEDI